MASLPRDPMRSDSVERSLFVTIITNRFSSYGNLETIRHFVLSKQYSKKPEMILGRRC